jgi:hypothetical protein
MGYETRLIVGMEAPSEGNLLDMARQKGIEVEQLGGLGREIRPLADLFTLWQLYRVLREWRPTIVHTHTAKAGVLGRIAARLAGVPVVVHTYHGHVLRGYFGPLKTAFFRRLETALNRVTDVAITVSAALRDDLAGMGVAPREKIRVVPSGSIWPASPGRTRAAICAPPAGGRRRHPDRRGGTPGPHQGHRLFPRGGRPRGPGRAAGAVCGRR